MILKVFVNYLGLSQIFWYPGVAIKDHKDIDAQIFLISSLDISKIFDVVCLFHPLQFTNKLFKGWRWDSGLTASPSTTQSHIGIYESVAYFHCSQVLLSFLTIGNIVIIFHIKKFFSAPDLGPSRPKLLIISHIGPFWYPAPLNTTIWQGPPPKNKNQVRTYIIKFYNYSR